jgi:class 3 adenylate cyclase
VVGCTILMASEAVRTHRRWMAALDGVPRPLAAAHGGRIAKSTGDGVLAEFATPPPPPAARSNGASRCSAA